MAGIKRTAADKWFSDYVRLRDSWTCQRCHRKFTKDELQGLDAAHCFGRGNNMTRFEPDNVVAMCYGCHSKMDSDPEAKHDMFIKRVGNKRYEELRKLSHQPYKGIKKEQKAISSRFRALFREMLEKQGSTMSGEGV